MLTSRRPKPPRQPALRTVVPYSALLTPTVAITRSGHLVSSFRLAGSSFDTSDTAKIADYHERLNLLWRTIADPQLALWTHLVRAPTTPPRPDARHPAFVAALNDAYQSRLEATVLRANTWYLTLVQRPGPDDPLERWPFRRRHGTAGEPDTMLTARLNDFERCAEQVLRGLTRYDVETLRLQITDNRRRSTQLDLYALLLNAEATAVNVGCGPLDELLPLTRPVIGVDSIEYRYATQRRLGAFLAIKDYPPQSYPGVLNALLRANHSLILTQSFAFLPKDVAAGLFQRQLNRMRSAGDIAVSQAAELKQAIDELASNRFAIGDHHLSLQILTDTVSLTEPSATLQRQLERLIASSRVALGDAGIVSVREDLALESAYRAQLPGNFSDRPRRAPITTRNFAGLAPFHGHPAGRASGNHWGNAIAVLKTTSGGPFFLSLHASDPTDTGVSSRRDTGHTFICGPTGSGKSVLVGFLIAQLAAQGVAQVVIDKDQGLEILVHALGGRYVALDVGQPSGLNPLRLDPTPANVDFLRRWLARLLSTDGTLSAPQQLELRQAVAGTLALPPDERRLSGLLEFLDPTDPGGLAARLRRWCRAGGGELAWVFDNDDDRVARTLGDSILVGIDMTTLLRLPDVRAPVAMYLFHLVRALLDGRRFVLWTDEFATVLDDPAFASFAKDGLKTWRKLNAVAAFATQSPSDVLASTIARTLVEQTPTKIFFANPDADYREYTAGFGLSDREYDIVRQHIQPGDRSFLLKQAQVSVVCELDLRGMEPLVDVISGRPHNVQRARELRTKLGDEPNAWLPEFYASRGSS